MTDQWSGADDRQEEPEEGGGELDGAIILVPDGEYELKYCYYETGVYFGTPRLVAHFTIVAPDDFAGLPAVRYYNVLRLTSPPGRYGNYVAKPLGDLYHELRQLGIEPKRRDRISLLPLKGKRIIGQLTRVTTTRDRSSRHEDTQYSKIEKLLRVLPDENWK